VITTVQFKTLDDLYAFYNKTLFAGRLADCIVNMSRHNGSYGFFAAKRWRTKEKGKERVIHEISLNPDYLGRPFKEWHATLIHEMVHLWQEDFGHASRAAYHNREWAGKMEEVGLIASDTGKPGGKKTGQRMTHYIKNKGLFSRTFGTLNAQTLEALRLRYLPAYPRPEPVERRGGVSGRTGGGKAGGERGIEDEEGGAKYRDGEEPPEAYNSKKKYSCPCGYNVWGKPGLRIICGECGGEFDEA
jgi:hypothetical protein